MKRRRLHFIWCMQKNLSFKPWPGLLGSLTCRICHLISHNHIKLNQSVQGRMHKIWAQNIIYFLSLVYRNQLLLFLFFFPSPSPPHDGFQSQLIFISPPKILFQNQDNARIPLPSAQDICFPYARKSVNFKS